MGGNFWNVPMRTILETRRLILREMTRGDLDFVAEVLGDAEVMQHYPKQYSRDEAEEWIARQTTHYATHGYGLWLAIEKASGRPVGMIGLVPRHLEGRNESEIAYLVHRLHWRQGLAVEAASAVRDYAFHRLGKPRVISLIRPENVPSQGVARKVGLRSEDRLVDHAGYPHLLFSLDRDSTSPAISGGWIRMG
jgi:RimJ/RimL family protein N-acetyltransferase